MGPCQCMWNQPHRCTLHQTCWCSSEPPSDENLRHWEIETILGILIKEKYNFQTCKENEFDSFSVHYRNPKVTTIITVLTGLDETVHSLEMTHSFFTWSAVSRAAFASVFSVPHLCVASSRTGLALCTRLLIVTWQNRKKQMSTTGWQGEQTENARLKCMSMKDVVVLHNLSVQCASFFMKTERHAEKQRKRESLLYVSVLHSNFQIETTADSLIKRSESKLNDGEKETDTDI